MRDPTSSGIIAKDFLFGVFCKDVIQLARQENSRRLLGQSLDSAFRSFQRGIFEVQRDGDLFLHVASSLAFSTFFPLDHFLEVGFCLPVFAGRASTAYVDIPDNIDCFHALL